MTKEILKNKVVTNSLYLYILQIFSTVIPLITLPYITRVLGVEQYGVFSKMLNYITYLKAFVEYGFALTGSKKVSLAQGQEEIDKAFSGIIFCKAINALLSFIVLFFLSIIFFADNGQWKCLAILSLLLLGEIFMQTWMLQGLQDMKFIMFVSVITNTISALLIFLFVKTPDDLLLYVGVYALTTLITAFVGVFVVMKKFRVRFVRVTFRELLVEYKEGWYLFTTSFATKVCTGMSITVLGIFASDAMIGGYSAIQKIPYILVTMFAPFGQALYPYMCRTYQEDTNKGISIIKKIGLGVLTLCVLGLALLIGLRHFVIKIVYGEEYLPWSNLVIPLGGWLVFSILNNILGIQILVARGYQKAYSYCFIVSVVLLVVLNFVMGYFFGVMGVAIATLIGEATLTALCVLVILKNRLLKKSINKNQNI